MRIRLYYSSPEFVHRQTPGESGVWGAARFESTGGGTFDGAVVYERLAFPQTIRCDPNRLIFIGGEPHSVRSYDPRFLAQFAAVIAPQIEIVHPRLIVGQPAIPWWVGVALTHQPDKSSAGYTLN